MKKLLLSLSLIFSASTNAIAQGIPVIDAASIAQYVQQLTAMKEQITNQISQIVELKNQVQALTSVDNLKGLAEDLASENIPDSWKDLYKDIQNLSDVEINKVLSSKSYNPQASGQLLVGYYQQLETTLKDLTPRFTKLTELQDRLRAAPDIKAAQDIQNQIGVEQGAIQLVQTQLDSMQRVYEVQEKVLREQKKHQIYCGFQKRAGNTSSDCQ